MKKAKVIAVVSGKGGTGKSTFSAGTALTLAKQNSSVLLVDLDFGLRSLDIMLGVEDKVIFDIGDIAEGKSTFDDAIISAKVIDESQRMSFKGKLQLLFSPVNINKTFALPFVIDLLKAQVEKYDYIILDLPAGLGLSIMMSKELADLICVVTVPDAVAIRDTQKVCSIIAQNCATPFKLVINRVSRTTLRTSGVRDLDDLMDAVGAPLLGVLHEDDKICKAFSEQGETKPANERASAQTKATFAAIARRIKGDDYLPLVVRNA